MDSLDGLVRIGTVSDVKNNSVRVIYQDAEITSDWLPVLRHADENYIPSVNDVVLVLYYPLFNADGFVLGVLPDG